MRTRSLAHFAVLAVLFIVGCDGQSKSTAEPDQDDPEQLKLDSNAELKKALQNVAATGEGGSELAGVREGIEALTDEKLKADLLADLEKLESTESPDAVKPLAAAMAEKL